MRNITEIITGIIMIISYLIGLGFIVIGEIGFKKLKKEFRKINCDVSETERKKRLPYMISEMERKKRLPYIIYRLVGCSIPAITSLIILILVYCNSV
ncbi:hypothetical protein [Clostridium sp.]|jgi:uncharacterized membrane protein|uniref:hypothetical protein n=1 Tax=Clostridium sp. TaxID=1506 RepID=UPI003EEBA39B